MKKQITISELKSLIKEEVKKFQKRTLLENKKKELIKEMSDTEDVVYLNRDLSDDFGLPYMNDGKQTVINSGALKRSNPEWDSKHLDIFEKYAGSDLYLQGVGYGWWKITNSNRGVNENMKKQITLSELRQIIRENIESLGMMENESKIAEAAAESINKGLYEIYDTYASKNGDDNYLLLRVDLPGIGKVYVNFDMNIEIIETPYYKPATMYRSNGNPGDPDEGSDGELGFNLKKITITKDEEHNEVLFTGMNDSLHSAFETITDEGEIYDRISESFWSDWNENRQNNRDDDDYRYDRGEEF